MKACAALLMAVMIIFSYSAAFCESGTSEIEKVLDIVMGLLDSSGDRAEEKTDPFSLWMYSEENPASPDDVPGIADRLMELGIDGITDAHVSEMIDAAKDAETYGYVFSREIVALNLLSVAGMGTYDDSFVWHPSSETVLYLDMELFGGDTLYGDFFRGLNAICRGEFVFSGIEEDYGQANLAEGVGVIGLSFLMNGEAYAVDAMMMQDWFDTGVFNAAAEIAVHPDNGKRLYAMYDGMQGLIIFYNTPEWAARFEAETGCPLLESLPASD